MVPPKSAASAKKPAAKTKSTATVAKAKKSVEKRVTGSTKLPIAKKASAKKVAVKVVKAGKSS